MAKVTLILVALACVGPAITTPPPCACCADSGMWDQTTRRVTAEEFAEIGRINFAATAATMVGPAGLEDVKGIASPAEAYEVRHHRPTRDWRLELQDRAGHKGELRFTIPDRATFFMADVQDGVTAAAGGPVLYKEWRLTGRALGAGAFKGGTFRLILQGRGNVCPDAGDFKTWILQVDGPGVGYTLFGRLAPPRPRPGVDAPPAKVAAPQTAQGDRDRMAWERGLSLEDEFKVQLAMAEGLDPSRADQVRRILLDARVARRIVRAQGLASEITTMDVAGAAGKQSIDTDRRLATVLTPKELAQLKASGNDAHYLAVLWLRSREKTPDGDRR